MADVKNSLVEEDAEGSVKSVEFEDNSAVEENICENGEEKSVVEDKESAADENNDDEEERDEADDQSEETDENKEVAKEENFENTAEESKGDEDTKVKEDVSDTNEDKQKNDKPRVFRRNIVRIPKEVFDYMARIEEDGVIRLNTTQFAVFLARELTKKASSVEADDWRTNDTVPILDVSVPPTAKENPTLIVDNFSNKEEDREAQELRLKNILGNKNRSGSRERYSSGGKMSGESVELQLSLEERSDVLSARRWRKRESVKGRKEKERAEGSNVQVDGKGSSSEMGKKRSAEQVQSGSAAKVARVDGKNTTSSNTGRNFSRRDTAQSGRGRSGARGGQARMGGRFASARAPRRNGFGPRGIPRGGSGSARRDTWRSVMPSYQQARAPPFAVNRRRYENAPAMSPNRGMYGGQRYEPSGRFAEQVRYDQQPSYGGQGFSSGGSPWSRPQNTDDLGSLELLMRRAAQENAKSFDKSPVVSGFSRDSSLSRAIPNLMEEPYERKSIRTDNFDRTAAPTRDISRFVEPLDYTESSRTTAPLRSSHVERIAYPGVGGGAATSAEGIGGAAYGQSFTGFGGKSYGLDNYGSGGGDSRTPMNRRRY